MLKRKLQKSASMVCLIPLFLLMLLPLASQAEEAIGIGETTNLPISFKEYLGCKFGDIAQNVCEKKYHDYEFSVLPSNIRGQIANEKNYEFYLLPSTSNLSVILAVDGESDTNEYLLHVFKDGHLVSTEEIGTSDGKNVTAFEINKNYVITINKMVGTSSKVKKSMRKKIQNDGKIVDCLPSSSDCN